MTVQSTTSRVRYIGNGVTTQLPVTFKFFSDSDLVVLEVTLATGVSVQKTLNSDYTVAGAGSDTGGTVIAAAAPGNTVEWVIYRDPAIVQAVEHTDNDPIPAASIDKPLDLLTMIAQRLGTRDDRSLHIPDSDPDSIVTALPSYIDRANKFAAYDANGNPTTAVGTSANLTPVSGYINGLLSAANAQSARDTLVAAGKPGSDTAHRLALWGDTSGNLADGPDQSTAGYVLTSNGASADPTFQAPQGSSFRNVLVNGGFQCWQRNQGGTFSNFTDNTYPGPDRWRCLVENANGASGVEVGSDANASLLLQGNGLNSKFGTFQVIEKNNCLYLESQVVTLSASLSVSNARIGNVKMALLTWTGTANATTGDPISAWNGEGTNPTLAANWAFVGTPANLNVGTSSARYQVSGTLPSSFANLAVLIWCDDKSYNSGDQLQIDDVQLEVGAATSFERRDFQSELARCRRYYQKSFPYGTTPAQNAGLAGSVGVIALGASNFHQTFVPLSAHMRTTPTVTFYNPSAANANARNVTDGADSNSLSSAIQNAGDSGFTVRWAGTATDNIYDYLAFHWSADAEI